MIGQTKSYEEEMKAVEHYAEEVGLYEEKESIKFNIKAYARYMLEHGLNDPDEVPAEVMETFWISKDQKPA
jgi:thiaminase